MDMMAECPDTAGKDQIAIVDFSALSIDKDELHIDHFDKEHVKMDVMESFTTTGFAYLKNHGVSTDLVNDVRDLSQKFFSLPKAVKEKYHRTAMHGYKGVENDSHGFGIDVKEKFDICPSDIQIWPKELNNFKSRCMELYSELEKLAHRIALVIAAGLNVKPELLKAILCKENSRSFTGMRILCYPPLSDDVKPPYIRLAEHTDCGAITIIFQDDVGGLEVKKLNGEWIDATPVPDAALVNIGDLMQMMSADRLKSTPHRIVLQADEPRAKLARYSTAFFLHPDLDTTISCLDGSEKYLPLSMRNYTEERFGTTLKT